MSNTAAPDFLPKEPSPLASQAPLAGDSLDNRMGESGLKFDKPVGETLDSSSAHVGTAQHADTTAAPFTAQAESEPVKGLTDASSANITSSGSGNASSGLGSSESITPSSHGQSTPGGVIKSQDHVENLVSAIGGIALSAPLAAYEALSGHAAKTAAVVSQQANERGLTELASTVQQQISTAASHPVVTSLGQQVSGAAAVAKDRLTTSDPNAPPISATLQNYAQAAADQASQLASRVGLTSGSTTAQTTSTDTTGAPTSSIGQTAQSYLQSATSSVQSATASATSSLQSLGERVGLTSPSTTTAAKDTVNDAASSAKQATSDLTAGSSSTPKNPFSADNLSSKEANEGTLTGVESKSASTGTGVDALPSLDPTQPAHNSSHQGATPIDDFERQLQSSVPGSAAYGEGRIGSAGPGQTSL